MKGKIIFLSTILIIMIIMPFAGVKNKIKPKEITKKTTQSYTNTDIRNTMYYEFRKEYSEETLKVLCVLVQTNYNKKTKENNMLSEKEFYDKYGKSSDEYKLKIDQAINKTFNQVIYINNTKVHIPYYYLTGATSSKKYSFLKNSAQPWDIINKEYRNYNTKIGISINTVNQLCKSGFDYKNAIMYFFDKEKISLRKNPEAES